MWTITHILAAGFAFYKVGEWWHKRRYALAVFMAILGLSNIAMAVIWL